MTTPPPSTWRTLINIARHNRRRLLATFGLVLLENLLMLSYPLFAGFAVNAVLAGDTLSALAYVALVLVMWVVGATRRSVDTRTFVRIYAEIAVPVIIAQRSQGMGTSAITARVALSREFVDFFEVHLPTLITALISIFGAAMMLLFLEFWVGIVGILILVAFALLLPGFAEANDRLYFKLNNRLEQEVDVIDGGKPQALDKHYGLVTRLRILISNREALGYLCVGLAMALLFAVALMLLSNKSVNAGHVYSVITYLWMFGMSLDDGPRLLEEFSKLRDIGKRVEV